MTNYCVRLYRCEPSDSATTADTAQGPMGALCGWAVDSHTHTSFVEETTVTFSDPDKRNQIANASAITLCAHPDDRRVDVGYVGILRADAVGADKHSVAMKAHPLAVIPLPGGRRLVEGNLILDAGSLVFQLS